MYSYAHVYSTVFIKQSRQKESEKEPEFFSSDITPNKLMEGEDFVQDSFNATYFESEFWLDRVNNLRDSVMTGLTGENIKDTNPNLIYAIHKYFIDRPRPFGRKFSNRLFKTPQVDVVLEIIGKKVFH